MSAVCGLTDLIVAKPRAVTFASVCGAVALDDGIARLRGRPRVAAAAAADMAT